jgi:hypothetical protein
MPSTPKEAPPPLEKAQSAFKHLSEVALDLNTASDELSQVVGALDEALKTLNLGITGWVKITGGEDSGGDFHWSRDIGYSKIGTKWGIALRERSGYYSDPEPEENESWLFAEAPRWLRAEGVGKIPELLEHLGKQAETTTKNLRKKTSETKALVEAIGCASAGASKEEF